MWRIGKGMAFAAVVVSIGTAAPAASADFFVDASATNTTGCTSAAPCMTIQEGVAAAEAAGGAQTVHVAAGAYAGEVDVTSGDVNIVGAGRSTTSSVANGTDQFALAITAASAEVSDMSFSVANGNHGTVAVVRGFGSAPSLTLDRVDLVNNATGNTTMGYTDDGLLVGVGATATVGSHSTVTINGTGQVAALDVFGGNLRFSDSTATSVSGAGFGGFVLNAQSNASIKVQRSVLNQENSSGTVGAIQTQGTGASVTALFDDDLIEGGADSFETAVGTADSTLNLYNDDLVPGGTNRPILADASASTGALHATLDSNLLFGTLPSSTHAAINCSYNNFPPGVTPSVSCDHTTNFDVNSLFPGGLDSTYDLSAGSAAIDAGDPAPLSITESTTDLNGAPRVQGSNGACVGTFRRDLGAVEYQGGAGMPLTIAVTGPDTGLTDTSLLFEATGISGGTYMWSYGDGTTSTDAVSTHHTFTRPGVYKVKATVSDPATGCSGSDTKTVTITSPVAAPTAVITTPSNGAAFVKGQIVRAAYSCTDGAGGPGIAACTGPVANGAAIDTSTVGSHTFKVTATSRSGKSGSATSIYTVVANAPPPPVISHAKESHAKWRLGGKAARISAAKHRKPLGTTFSFKLNMAATVTFTFTKGSRVKGRFSFPGHTGTNKVFFDGPIPHGGTLKRGSYTLTITAYDAFSRNATPRTLSFKIVQ